VLELRELLVSKVGKFGVNGNVEEWPSRPTPLIAAIVTCPSERDGGADA
jgi:hypothetical protein